MSSALLTAALFVAAGIPVALALPARPRRLHGLLGEAFLLGAGAAMLALMSLSAFSIPWSRGSLLGALIVVISPAVIVAWRRGRFALDPLSIGAANLIDLLTLAIVFGHGLFATAAPPVESDYLLIWGVKARVFFVARGIDWKFLEAPLNVTAHVDYPLLTSLGYDVHAILNGAWPEAAAGFWTFAFGAAAILAVRGLLSTEMSRIARAMTTLLLAPLLLSPYVGLAEGPLIAYATVAVLYVRRGVRDADRGDVLRGALFLGLAASCKNEGLAMIAAAAIAIIAARAVRMLPSLWPALAVPVPWLVLKHAHRLTVDLAEEGVVTRVSSHLAHPGAILHALLSRGSMSPLFWAGCVLAVVIGARYLASRERFLVMFVAVQLAFYIAAYFVTPHDVTWHVQTSWDRILRQIMPLIALIAVFPSVVVIASAWRRRNATEP